MEKRKWEDIVRPLPTYSVRDLVGWQLEVTLAQRVQSRRNDTSGYRLTARVTDPSTGEIHEATVMVWAMPIVRDLDGLRAQGDESIAFDPPVVCTVKQVGETFQFA